MTTAPGRRPTDRQHGEPVGGDTRPDLDAIEGWFAAVAEGRVSRDAADRWAGRWYFDDDDADAGEEDGPEREELRRWALDLLHGIDLRPGPEQPYLHDDAQVRDWLAELRRRRARPPRTG
ncbi:hypothetical protein [Kitasatospora camelliae]|uniref:CdiI immunity protein domain-containing protein n=1 Tax=Kitasatospora camelliae TaxID=3156397 RepID=A0AAU8K5J8_9ACTN